jgi:hypothetical protein
VLLLDLRTEAAERADFILLCPFELLQRDVSQILELELP